MQEGFNRCVRSRWGLTVLCLSLLLLGTTGPANASDDQARAVSVEGSSSVMVKAGVVQQDVLKNIRLTGFADGEIKTVTVSLEPYVQGDVLKVEKSASGITVSDPVAGLVTLTGAEGASAADFQTLLQSVSVQLKDGSDDQERELIVSVGSGLWHKVGNTLHKYEFVPKKGITWEEARVAADERKYLDAMQGYLVTITSQAEMDFVKTKLQGYGWMGASDKAQEGIWRWVTGPEGLEEESGGKGRLIPNRLNPNSEELGSRYKNWASGEPNEVQTVGGEDYAHFYNNGAWNDFPNDPGKYNESNKSFKDVDGYVVEYGGMPGDQTVAMAASVTLTTKEPSESNITIDRARELVVGNWKPNGDAAVEVVREHRRKFEDYPELNASALATMSTVEYSFANGKLNLSGTEAGAPGEEPKKTVIAEVPYEITKASRSDLRDLAARGIPGGRVRALLPDNLPDNLANLSPEEQKRVDAAYKKAENQILEPYGEEYGNPFGATLDNLFLLTVTLDQGVRTDKLIILNDGRMIQVSDRVPVVLDRGK
ncbi:MAG: C-type lectin domain-containing protein [Acidobacteriota bacterium]